MRKITLIAILTLMTLFMSHAYGQEIDSTKESFQLPDSVKIQTDSTKAQKTDSSQGKIQEIKEIKLKFKKPKNTFSVELLGSYFGLRGQGKVNTENRDYRQEGEPQIAGILQLNFPYGFKAVGYVLINTARKPEGGVWGDFALSKGSHFRFGYPITLLATNGRPDIVSIKRHWKTPATRRIKSELPGSYASFLIGKLGIGVGGYLYGGRAQIQLLAEWNKQYGLVVGYVDDKLAADIKVDLKFLEVRAFTGDSLTTFYGRFKNKFIDPYGWAVVNRDINFSYGEIGVIKTMTHKKLKGLEVTALLGYDFSKGLIGRVLLSYRGLKLK